MLCVTCRESLSSLPTTHSEKQGRRREEKEGEKKESTGKVPVTFPTATSRHPSCVFPYISFHFYLLLPSCPPPTWLPRLYLHLHLSCLYICGSGVYIGLVNYHWCGSSANLQQSPPSGGTHGWLSDCPRSNFFPLQSQTLRFCLSVQ